MKQMDGFERSVKDALEDFEVPYNSADWSRLQQALDGKQRLGWLKGGGFYAALVAAGVTVVGGVYLLGTRSTAGEPQFALVEPVALVADAQPTASTTQVSEEPLSVKKAVVEPKERKKDPVAEPIAVTEEPKQQRVIYKRADGSTWEPSLEEEKNRKAENSSLTINPSLNEGCPGTTIEFAAGAAPDGGIFLWNFGDGSFSNKNTPDHTYTKSGTYKVILSLSNTSGGAINNRDASDNIVIFESPDASFTPMKRSGTDNLPTMHFENKSHSGASYHWDFGDGSTSNTSHPDHLFKKRGTYPVELTVTNEKGCVDRSKKDIIVTEDYNLMAPPSFSPNGDGTLDRFIPEALRSMQQKFTFLVYDAKGGLLFRTTDATMPWDGSVNNLGKDLLPTGQYLWVVDLGNETYNGHVILVR